MKNNWPFSVFIIYIFAVFLVCALIVNISSIRSRLLDIRNFSTMIKKFTFRDIILKNDYVIEVKGIVGLKE